MLHNCIYFLKMNIDLGHPDYLNRWVGNPTHYNYTPSSCLTCTKLPACMDNYKGSNRPNLPCILNSSQLWNLKPMQHASSFWNYAINTCWASSLVGANTSAWVSLNSISNCCRMEIANVAVLPVPDWAWAITSYPKKSRIHIYRSHKLPLLLHTMYSIWHRN